MKELNKYLKMKTENFFPKGENFLYIDNGADILGVAHADTVFDEYENIPLWENELGVVSGALDDRLGCWALMEYLKGKFDYDILITDGEESGSSTASLFEPTKKYNWMFELDRRGTDAVTYCYDNLKWNKKINQFFKKGNGSFSDISIMESLGCCGVNIGVGYHDEHNINCYFYWKDFEKQMEKLINFQKKFGKTLFPHEERLGGYGNYGYYYSNYHGTWGGNGTKKKSKYAISNDCDNDTYWNKVKNTAMANCSGDPNLRNSSCCLSCTYDSYASYGY